MPDWSAFDNGSGKFRTPGEKWAAVLLSASVVAIALMYSSSLHRRAAAQTNTDPKSAARLPENHLAGSTSPYLLQHAHNPVDWYPWGPEALERARKRDRPIFLSVGYSSCHWCHVMEREDFENQEIARLMNERFVCIKVDREERPDIDDQYQLAVQIITGSGGWPMSVWLTPDLKPFHAGTYIPPDEFKKLLTQIADLWDSKRKVVVAQADMVTSRMQSVTEAAAGKPGGAIPADIDARAVAEDLSAYDRVNGGFGSKPKFPEAPRLLFLIDEYRRHPRPDLKECLTHTLNAMASGGIHDQLDGGFHRYSTDQRWLIPHFEKMLYDQALLADSYLAAASALHEDSFRATGAGILDFVLQSMTDPQTGGFYTSIDADSGGEEGSYYLWRPSEIEELLGKANAALFERVYGVKNDGSYQADLNVLHVSAHPAAGDAAQLKPLREKLLAARSRRTRPAVDDKVVSGLNGLMIEALANGYGATGAVKYRDAAVKAAEYVCRSLMKPDGSLLRMERGEQKGAAAAFPEDYAYLARAMLALYRTTHDTKWIERAELLCNQLNRQFWKRGDADGFYQPGPTGGPVAASDQGEDNATPSANGIAAMDLVELAGCPTAHGPRPAPESERLRTQASKSVKAFAALIAREPGAFASLLLARDAAASARAH